MSHHNKVYENMIEAIHNPKHEFSDAFDEAKTVEIIENIYISAALK